MNHSAGSKRRPRAISFLRLEMLCDSFSSSESTGPVLEKALLRRGSMSTRLTSRCCETISTGSDFRVGERTIPRETSFEAKD
jgi:hypothetical protein